MRVSRRAAELRAAGHDIIDFGAGEPDFPSPPVAVAAARQALADGFTRYTAAVGTPQLRKAVAARYAARYGSPWTIANTVISVGAKASLLQIILCLIDDGDEVVLPTPAWVSFEEQIRLAGGRPVGVPTSWRDRFAIHAEPLLEAITPRTRMVLINAPSNPTGGLMAAPELRQLVSYCAAHDIVVLSDETYERFIYDGASFASAATLAEEFPETVAVVGSFSKAYAMTGWRVGYCLGALPLIAKVGEIQSHATSNPTSFAMSGALAALEGAEPEVEAMVAEFAARRDLLLRGLTKIPGVRCQPPAGAFYAFPDVSACYREGCSGSIAFAEHLLESAGVALVPGLAFGDDNHVRISFACSRDTLATGLERIAATVREQAAVTVASGRSIPG